MTAARGTFWSPLFFLFGYTKTGFRVILTEEYRKEVIEVEVSTALLHHGRDGPSFRFGKEVNEVATCNNGDCDRPGGLAFWLAKLEDRIRRDEVQLQKEKWGTLKAHLATELTKLEKIFPSRVGEVFEYFVQVLRFWIRKSAGGKVETNEITDLYEWGMRLSLDLPEKDVIDQFGQNIRDTFMGKTEVSWQARSVRTQRPKGR